MWKLNKANLAAGIRTAGALMTGNAFVGYLVFDKPLVPVSILFLIGFCVTFLWSFERK
jgi:hypothetical protein